MSNDLNMCQFIGRLGRDPEVRYLPSGDAVCNFSIAVGWKTKDKEGTEWVRCDTVGKLAEIAGEYLHKGKQCYVAGRFSTREWEKDGVKQYSTSIRVDKLQLLGGGRSDRDDDDDDRPAPAPAPRQQQSSGKSSTGFDDMDDDIPF